MKNKKSVLVLIIIGVVFISGCVQEEETGDEVGEAIEPADLTQLTFFVGSY